MEKFVSETMPGYPSYQEIVTSLSTLANLIAKTDNPNILALHIICVESLTSMLKQYVTAPYTISLSD